MKRVSLIVYCVLWIVISMGSLTFAQEDAKGCKDHPLFTRMPNFYIASCETTEYDEVKFYAPPEGEKYMKLNTGLRRGLREKQALFS